MVLGEHVAGPSRPRSAGGGPAQVGRQITQQHQEFVRRGASLGLLVQARFDDRPQGIRHGAQRRLLVHHLVSRYIGAVRVEGTVARRRVHQERPQREDVGARPHAARRLQLLGRHEGWRADDPPGHRQRLLVHGARDAEVDDAGSLGREDDVRGLQVPVDDSHPVDVAQRLRETDGEPPQLRPVQGALVGDALGERGPLDVGRRHPGLVGLGGGVDHGGGERSAHPSCGGHLLPEPDAEFVVPRELLVDQFDRDGPAGARPGQEDRAHATRTEPFLQRITADLGWITSAQRHSPRPPVPRASVSATTGLLICAAHKLAAGRYGGAKRVTDGERDAVL
ncbi:hypothetical protein P376_1599 [Streptomyces sp. HCCB10043]|nr:hypothetical protein P376_1599 [Streptomyces sp. HCCB10043]